MVRLAAGEALPLAGYRHAPRGHAIEVRLYAEDPNQDFQPSAGVLTDVAFPPTSRVDGWVERGSEVTPYLRSAAREADRQRRDRATTPCARMQARRSRATRLAASRPTSSTSGQSSATDVFRAGTQTTRYLRDLAYAPATIDVREPGRTPPCRIIPVASGTGRSACRRRARWTRSRSVSRTASSGIRRRPPVSNVRSRVRPCVSIATPSCASAGAAMAADLDGARGRRTGHRSPVPPARRCGSATIEGGGLRTFVAIRGGLDVPDYLGSKSTFTLGRFGGHAGRASAPATCCTSRPTRTPRRSRSAGGAAGASSACTATPGRSASSTDRTARPTSSPPPTSRCCSRPTTRVHYNSSRTGVRLVGPKPVWARRDGGEAGLHPRTSTTTATRSARSTSPATCRSSSAPTARASAASSARLTIAAAELWKVGQLRPGDTGAVRARLVRRGRGASRSTGARDRDDAAGDRLRGRRAPAQRELAADVPASAVLRPPARRVGSRRGHLPPVRRRRAPRRVRAARPRSEPALPRPRPHDLARGRTDSGRDRSHPGIRSLHVHVDGRALPARAPARDRDRRGARAPAVDDMEVPTRIVAPAARREDEATLLAIRKYMQIVRKDAPWCPSNIEFIRRINGLESVEQVREIVFGASYLVLGPRRRLSRRAGRDAGRSAPPPRHHQVQSGAHLDARRTPSASAARTSASTAWRGRAATSSSAAPCRCGTVSSRRAISRPASRGCCASSIRSASIPMGAAELLRYRADFLQGKCKLDVRVGDVSARATTTRFSRDERDSIAAFKARQQAAFEAERERWAGAHRSSSRRARSGRGRRTRLAVPRERDARRDAARPRERLADRRARQGATSRRATSS